MKKILKIPYLLIRGFCGFFIENIVNNTLVRIGSNSYIDPTTSIRYPKNIKIGNNTYINKKCIIWPGDKSKITIGDNVLFGPNVKLYGANHSIKLNDQIINQESIYGDITIKNDVWIGSDTVILKGVVVEDGVVVGANSVINSNLEKNGVYAGSPAKLIKFRE